MVSKEQAITGRDFHYGHCNKVIGKRGGEKINITNWRANGQCKTWKTRPDEFRLPIKFGMYGYDYLTNYNADQFHLAEDCPVLGEGE